MIEPHASQLALATGCHGVQTFTGRTSFVIHGRRPFPSSSLIGRTKQKDIAILVADHGDADSIAAEGNPRTPPHAERERIDGGNFNRLRETFAAIVGAGIANASLHAG